MRQDRVHVRLVIIAGVALLWMGAVFGRLSYLELFRHSDYLARALRQQQRTFEITPERGAAALGSRRRAAGGASSAVRIFAVVCMDFPQASAGESRSDQ